MASEIGIDTSMCNSYATITANVWPGIAISLQKRGQLQNLVSQPSQLKIEFAAKFLSCITAWGIYHLEITEKTGIRSVLNRFRLPCNHLRFAALHNKSLKFVHFRSKLLTYGFLKPSPKCPMSLKMQEDARI